MIPFVSIGIHGGRSSYDGGGRRSRRRNEGGVAGGEGASVSPGKRQRAEDPHFRDKLLNRRPGREGHDVADHVGDDAVDGIGDDDDSEALVQDGSTGGGRGSLSGDSDEGVDSPEERRRPLAPSPMRGQGRRIDQQHRQRTERRRRGFDLQSEQSYEDPNDDNEWAFLSPRGGGDDCRMFSGLLPAELANDADRIGRSLDSPLNGNKKPSKQQIKQRQHGRAGTGVRSNGRALAPTQPAASAGRQRRPVNAPPHDPLNRALVGQGRKPSSANVGRTEQFRGSSAREVPGGRKRQSYGSKQGRLQHAVDRGVQRSDMKDWAGSTSSNSARRGDGLFTGGSMRPAASHAGSSGERDPIRIDISEDEKEKAARKRKKKTASPGGLTEEEVRHYGGTQQAHAGQEIHLRDEAVAKPETDSDGNGKESAFNLTRVAPEGSVGDARIPRKKKAFNRGPTTIQVGASIPGFDASQTSTVTRPIRQNFTSLQTRPRRIRQTKQPQPPSQSTGSTQLSSSTPSSRSSSRKKSTGVDPRKFYSGSKNTSDDLVDSEEEKPRSMSKKKRLSQSVLEALPGGNRRSTRSTSRRMTRSYRSSQKATVITIDTSSDEDEGPDNDETNQLDMDEERQIELAKRNSLSEVDSPSRKRKFGSRHPLSVVRIAIGKKIFSSNCTVEFQLGTRTPFLELSYKNNSSETDSVKLALNDDTITELKYYLVDDKEQSSGDNVSTVRGSSLKTEDTTEETSADDHLMSGYNSPTDEVTSSSEDQITFIAIRVTPNTYNGLGIFKKSYAQNEGDSSDPSKRYIVIELRSEEQFLELLPKLRSSSEIVAALLDGNKNLSLKEACKYTTALAAEDEKEKKQRLSSSPRKTRSMSARGANTVSSCESDTVLLVYPFVGGNDIERAAVDLKEAKGDFLQQESNLSDDNATPMLDAKMGNSTAEQVQTEATSGRTHYLTIRGEDRDRLDPMEFLNDTLVDFWMRWIWRKEVPSKSDVYFFSSHFFTTLDKDGAEAVSSWTARKNIDIFSKRFIFLPINHSLHWSLCVVANPGFIENSIACSPDDAQDDDEDLDKDLPCIIFLDSLKAHQKQKVAKKVRLWLNFEWKRLEKEMKKDELKQQLGSSPVFSPKYMKVYDPKIPYQNNSWDCGVFVCRYAYGLYQRRNRRITFRDLVGVPLRKSITDSEEFQFGMNDIERMRQEMGTLIDNLSLVYLRVKEKETEEKRAKKLMKKQKKEAQENSDEAEKREEACNPEKAEDDTSCAASGRPTHYYV